MKTGLELKDLSLSLFYSISTENQVSWIGSSPLTRRRRAIFGQVYAHSGVKSSLNEQRSSSANHKSKLKRMPQPCAMIACGQKVNISRAGGQTV